MLRIVLALGVMLLSGQARAVDQPSTYPGCAQREVAVAWGGSATVDLSACQSFGLGALAQAPAHGRAFAEGAPALAYVYAHDGKSPAGGGEDRFVVLDDNSDTITVRVAIAAPDGEASLALASPSLPALRAGRAVRQPLAAGGGRAPLRWRLVGGALPAGLALEADGVLVGTPTARGPFVATVEASDASGRVANLSLAGEVAPPEIRLIPPGARATRGEPFRQALHARGGVPPYRFTLEPGGQPPTGITLDDQGVFTGLTAVPPGHYAVTVRITDASTGPGTHFTTARFVFRVLPDA